MPPCNILIGGKDDQMDRQRDKDTERKTDRHIDAFTLHPHPHSAIKPPITESLERSGLNQSPFTQSLRVQPERFSNKFPPPLASLGFNPHGGFNSVLIVAH